MDGLALAVAVALHQDRVRAVLLVDAGDLPGDDVGRFVPRDADVLALAAVLRVPLAVGIPVDALEGVLDAVRGVRALLVGGHVGRRARSHARLQGLAVALELPGAEALAVVLPVELERPDAHDLAGLDVDHDFAGAAEEAALGQGPEHGLVGAHVHSLPRVATHIDRCPFAIGEVLSAWASVC